MLIEIVADIVCPWCFIGWRRLQRALKQRPDVTAEITWRAFQLNPGPRILDLPPEPPAGRSAAAPRRMNELVSRAGDGEGIAFRLDGVERMPNSFNAHRLVKLAARQQCQSVLMDILFHRYFESGADLGNAGVLVEAAAAAGLDPAEAAAFLVSDAERDAVMADDRNARRLGLNGVPCFIVGRRFALSGAQEPEFFLPLFDLALTEENRSAAAE